MVKRYGLVIDLERCIGCNTCTIACKVENGMEVGSGIRVETVGGAHRDTPAGSYPELSMHYQAIFYGDLADPKSQVSQLIAQRTAYTLKPELAVGPAIHYCPPKTRRQV